MALFRKSASSDADLPLAALTETLRIARWALDLQANRTTWSGNLRALLGLPDDAPEDMGKYTELLTPQDRKQLEAKMQRALVQAEGFRLNQIVRKPDGTYLYIRLVAELETSPEGKPLRIIGTLQDISDQLHEAQRQRRLSHVVEQTQSGVVILDRMGRTLFTNPAFTQITGYKAEEMQGQNPFELLAGPDTDAATQQRLMRGLEEGDAFAVEIQYRDKQGHLDWLNITLTPEVDYEGKLDGYIVLMDDITERKEAELLNQKLTAELQEKNQDITDSIVYARRIQFSLLPDQALLAQNLPEHFVLYHPKDIVSGDFYWFAEHEGAFYVAAVDCTGHGVPGAFMSVLGFTQLNELLQAGYTEAGPLVQALDERISSILTKNVGANEKVMDGMDLCLLRREANGKVTYAGANRPIMRLRNGEMATWKTDKHAIGPSGSIELDKTFHTYEADAQPGDVFYLFSDGMTDQFGGERGRKYTRKQLEEALLATHPLGLEAQGQAMEQKLTAWMNGYAQTDDIILMGLKMP